MTLPVKKLFLLFIFPFLSLVNDAQITITNSDMPGSGDTARYSSPSLFGSIDYQSTGANYTWDFSTLVPVSQGLYEYKSSMQINPAYMAFFGPGSFGQKVADSINLVVITLNNVYDFYTKSPQRFKAVGRGMEMQGFPIPSSYTDDDEIYEFPLGYGDHDSSTFTVSLDLDTIMQYHQSGWRVTDAEGWGTIMTPYDTVSCLKIKSVIHQKDSLVIGGFGLPAIERVLTEYKWLSNTEFVPLLEIKGEDIFGFYTVNSVKYRDHFRANVGINEANPGFSFNVWPNPVSNSLLNITWDKNNIRFIEIFSIAGKKILSVPVGGGIFSTQLNVSALAKGTYFIKLTGENISAVRIFIKE